MQQKEEIQRLKDLVVALTAENLRLTGQIKAQKSKEDPEFITFMEEWLEVHSMKVRPSTYGGYRTHINTHLKPFFGGLNLKLSELTAMHHEQRRRFSSNARRCY